MKFKTESIPYYEMSSYAGSYFIDEEDEHTEYHYFIEFDGESELHWNTEVPYNADEIEILILEQFNKRMEG